MTRSVSATFKAQAEQGVRLITDTDDIERIHPIYDESLRMFDDLCVKYTGPPTTRSRVRRWLA